MTLRLKLVLAMVALLTVALGTFFAVTYVEYRSSEYAHLESQLRESEPAVDQYLDAEAGGSGQHPGGMPSSTLGPGPPGGARPGTRVSPQVVLPPGTFAELRTAQGAVVDHYLFSTDSAQPDLPSKLPPAGPSGRFFTVGAEQGTSRFEVFEAPAAQGGTTLIAIPTTEVTNALDRLALIEAAGIGGLLLVVSVGAWFALRTGLRPLERMADTARRISAGDFSRRVSPSGGKSEVGELGLALNTMLGDIETAFAERDATERRLRQFLADASHELRTPLTSIQGFAELFRLHGDDARVDLPTILRRIEEESARMSLLVEDLLLLARLDQHRPIEKKPLDLAVLAADACADAVATEPDRPVTLEAPEPVLVAADESHLRQALANLLSNALRHTPAGTPLEISCLRSATHASISVRDHGGGLDAETIAHAFDRFWQGDSARVGQGVGLGLSIVAAVAAEHGGTVAAANASGGGAVFTLALPLDTSQDRGQVVGGSSAAGAAPGGGDREHA